MDPRRVLAHLEPGLVRERQHAAALVEDARRFPSPFEIMMRRLYLDGMRAMYNERAFYSRARKVEWVTD